MGERSGVVQAVWVAHVIGNAHVAALAPGCAPRVADLESAGGGVVAHRNDRVVNLAEDTARLGENSGSVQLPRVVCVDGDGDRNRVDSGLEGGVVLSNRIVSSDGSLGQSLGDRGLASSIPGRVRVAALRGDAGLANVRNAVLVVTTTAAVRPGVAVHQLLFRIVSQLACCDCVGTLHGSHGGEGPATAALSLILDWVDNRLVGGPINIVGNLALHFQLTQVRIIFADDAVSLQSEVLGSELI